MPDRTPYYDLAARLARREFVAYGVDKDGVAREVTLPREPPLDASPFGETVGELEQPFRYVAESYIRSVNALWLEHRQLRDALCLIATSEDATNQELRKLAADAISLCAPVRNEYGGAAKRQK